uniref:Lipase_3 domain-containing protein n=1 Tax=Panagrellus redivivus TaxID=6233 RepID=A0A7E4WAP9_PANRE
MIHPDYHNVLLRRYGKLLYINKLQGEMESHFWALHCTMKLLFVTVFAILSIVCPINAAFDEGLAQRMVNFAAATFLEPTAADVNEKAQSCFRKSYPASNFTNPKIYSIGQCADYIEDECQVMFTESADEKLLIVAFRGTVGMKQMKHEASDSLKDLAVFDPENNAGTQYGQVNSYFYNAMQTLWNRIDQFQTVTAANYPGYTVIFTGHSLGGAMASLSALRVSLKNSVPADKIKVYTFGEPRVSDFKLAETMKTSIPDSWRVVHYEDPVPHMPFCSGVFSDSCKTEPGHPYHRPTEIWYSNSNQKMESGDYKQCDTTNGEDPDCSNKVSILKNIFNIIDSKGGDFHNHYYDHLLNEYGPNGCSSGATVGITAAMVLLGIAKMVAFIF